MICKSTQIIIVAEVYVKKIKKKKLIPTTIQYDCRHCRTLYTAVFRLFQIFSYNSEMIFRIRI